MSRVVLLLVLLLTLSCQKQTSWKTPQGGDFTLHSQRTSFNLRDLRGKTVFLFFGFLQCPQVCPTTLRELDRLVKSLPPKERARVAVVFVSVDPRDTEEKLKEFLLGKDPTLIAVSGTKEEVMAAMELYGGSFRIIQGKDPSDVIIDHTSSVFVLSRKGVWVNSLDYDSSREQFQRALDLSHSQAPYWTEKAREERVKFLGENETCDLAESDCEFTTDDGETFAVKLSPKPVRHLEDLSIKVSSKDSKLTPKLVDLVGIETSMGLLRPSLKASGEGLWSATVRIPSCDLRGMHWDLRLLLEDRKKENQEIRFRFSSVNPKI